MKDSNSLLIERMIREMRFRNISERSIRSYCASMSKVQSYFNLPIDNITTQQFKDFLYHRITVDKISVSIVNQSINAFKIMQVDILGREWERQQIKAVHLPFP